MAAEGDVGEGSSGGSGYGGSSSGIKSALFILSLLTRLCLLLHHDHKAKLVFQGSGQELSMEQQRNRVNRDDYWHTVSERFNSADFQPCIDARPELPLETLDLSTTPTSPVSGLKLKTLWTDMRGPFKKSHNDVKKSDQNDRSSPVRIDIQPYCGPFDSFKRTEMASFLCSQSASRMHETS